MLFWLAVVSIHVMRLTTGVSQFDNRPKNYSTC
jgi:hypothetical protein